MHGPHQASHILIIVTLLPAKTCSVYVTPDLSVVVNVKSGLKSLETVTSVCSDASVTGAEVMDVSGADVEADVSDVPVPELQDAVINSKDIQSTIDIDLLIRYLL